jgi:Zn-dependent protease with chaperone function
MGSPAGGVAPPKALGRAEGSWLLGGFVKRRHGVVATWMPYIGLSIFLMAVGAILAFAVTTEAEGFNINTAGVILLILGVVTLLIALLWEFALADRRVGPGVVREREPPPEREVVREREPGDRIR